MWFGGGQTDKEIVFDFFSPRIITEAKWYQDIGSTHGTWKWQGSNDKSSWTDIGSPFTLGGVATQTQTELSGNTTAYIYYRLLQTAGVTSSGPYIREIEFKIGWPAAVYDIVHDLGSGDRDADIAVTTNGIMGSASGVVSAIVDGSAGTFVNTNSIYWSAGQSNIWLQFDFGTERWFSRAYLLKEPAGATEGTWKWQGSNDAAAWTDLLTGIALGTDQYEHYFLGANAGPWRYLRLLQTAGVTTTNPWLKEILFGIDPGP
jgi:hypothetical protein